MTCTLAHRGPDDDGHWQDEDAGIVLGHRRLSIVDLSQSGHQPMVSASGRYVIVFNGEVYNHARLRPGLQAIGVGFRGRSDTEVMLAAIEQWGLEAALNRFIGMFAFALWDREDSKLVLVRDRLGIKPLYYGWTGAGFVFGSELKALRAAPGFSNTIDRDALALMLRHSAIPAPYSIYQGIYKLMPGSLMRVDRELAVTPAGADALTARASVYWSARQVAESSSRRRFSGGTQRATAELDYLLRDAVGLRMEADVPLGAFLSGGVDSSTVVALMQAQAARPVRTFSIGFDEAGFDEAQYARAVARHLGTEHTELYVTPQQARDIVPQLPSIYDEPFADSSQIPTLLVSRLARREVTVSLSGDGGDELFCGYGRYFDARRLWRTIGFVPSPLRRVAAGCLRAAPGPFEALVERGMRLLPQHLRLRSPHDKRRRVAELLSLSSPDALYGKLVSHCDCSTALVYGSRELLTALTDPARRVALADATERMMFADVVSYLPADILTKVDRASMAVSLETRVPLLDHRVVEFAWRLPLALKIRDGQSKWLLRQVLYRYVPRELIERPKLGFGVPIERWLRGQLRDWAEELLDERRLREEGFFDPAPVRAMWQSHIAGSSSEHYRLWNILMFQAWLDSQRGPTTRKQSAAASSEPVMNLCPAAE